MQYKGCINLMAIAVFGFSGGAFAGNVDDSSNHSSHSVIADMPQELQDFFETSNSCELWISFYDRQLDNITIKIVEDRIENGCDDLEKKLAAMKLKYKNHKGYLERLNVYNDTVFIYKEFEKRFQYQALHK